LAKRQRGADPIDALGGTLPEVSAAVELAYPDGAKAGYEHYYDPLKPLVGPVQDVTPGKKKKGKKAVGGLTATQVEETKERRRRYDTFIDQMIENGGDQIYALAMTYGVSPEEIRANLINYKTDVMTGMNSSSVSDLLEHAGIGKAARIGILRKHVYSTDARESLVALKMALDLDGDKHNTGTSYESYLRMVLNKEA
jgi:hypothetical protein